MPQIQPQQPYDRPWQQFKGLLPAFDPRNINQPFILKGQNFLLDTDGPYSAFSNKIANYDQLSDGSIVQSFRIEADTLLFVKGAVFKFDTPTRKYILQFVFDDTGDVWPWSYAYVNTKYYFCRKGVGVIEYDPALNAWLVLSTFVPTGARAVCEAVGRLIVLGELKIAWSAQDDGSNLTPDLTNGAGFDFLSAYVGGTGFSVRTAADGFYTFTTKGFFKSEYNFVFNSATAPFRHYTVDGSRTYKPINQWCIASVDDSQHVFLDTQGLFSVQSNKITPFAAAFSEWLRHKLLPQYDLTQTQIFKLSFLSGMNTLFLSVSDYAKPYLYSMAYALYMPLEEWGVFNYAHYGFVELYFDGVANNGFNEGFVDNFGITRRFVQDPYNEAIPTNTLSIDVIDWVPSNVNPPMYFSGDTLVGVSEFNITALKTYILINYPAGNYTINPFDIAIEPPLAAWVPYNDNEVVAWQLDIYDDWMVDVGTEDWAVMVGAEDWGTTGSAASVFVTIGLDMSTEATYWDALVYAATSLSLNSYIDVGFAKLTTGKYTDEISTITEITVGFDSQETGLDLDDYQGTAYPLDVNFDWNAGSGNEDWGTFLLQNTAFDLTVFGTNDDGTNTFTTEIPTLYKDTGSARIFKCMNPGMYHYFRISALNVNQSFHLHLLDWGAIVTGRL